MALDIARFVGMEQFLDSIEQMKCEIKDLPKKEGFDKICMPGEPEFDRRGQQAVTGIPVSDVVYDDLERICNSYGVRLEV